MTDGVELCQIDNYIPCGADEEDGEEATKLLNAMRS
jgi:hypothetical protein